jgi:hypothetical protein
MDGWVSKRSASQNGGQLVRAPLIAFFSFGPAAGILSASRPQWPSNARDYLYEFCRQTHLAIREFADANPEARVIIKPKWAGDWLDKLDDIWGSSACTLPQNLSIQTGISAQSLIRTSDVVVGFNSTVLLEAGIIGKPVIFPLFAEAAATRWRDFIMFYDDRHAFEVATSPDELRLLLKQVAGTTPTAAQMHRRRVLFETYVGPLDGSALMRYRDWIDSSIMSVDNGCERAAG